MTAELRFDDEGDLIDCAPDDRAAGSPDCRTHSPALETQVRDGTRTYGEFDVTRQQRGASEAH